MMDTSTIVRTLAPLLQGLALGFSIAAPVGPIGVLCIRQTLERGWQTGLLTGLGAATADMLYGAVAAFGITMISKALLAGQSWLRLAGGIFLLYLGAKTFFRKTGALPRENGTQPDRKAFLTTFALTLTNPVTIVAFAAIIAGLGPGHLDAGYLPALLLVLGVFLGSSAWWLLLSSSVNLLRHRIGPQTLTWINRLSGLTIFIFGLLALRLVMS
jgi:threonine/homoserine/homoserine lactone efflux protein